MTSTEQPGLVESWHAEDGWGVVRLEGELPVWVHWSVVERSLADLHPGERVRVWWERRHQDGFEAAATRVVPLDGTAVRRRAERRNPGIYHSTLTLSVDESEGRASPGA